MSSGGEPQVHGEVKRQGTTARSAPGRRWSTEEKKQGGVGQVGRFSDTRPARSRVFVRKYTLSSCTRAGMLLVLARNAQLVELKSGEGGRFGGERESSTERSGDGRSGPFDSSSHAGNTARRRQTPEARVCPAVWALFTTYLRRLRSCRIRSDAAWPIAGAGSRLAR